MREVKLIKYHEQGFFSSSIEIGAAPALAIRIIVDNGTPNHQGITLTQTHLALLIDALKAYLAKTSL